MRGLARAFARDRFTRMPVFSESQRSPGWAKALVVFIALLPIVGVAAGVSQGVAESRPPAYFAMVALGLLVPVVLIAFIVSLDLHTEVRPDGVYVRFAPFHRAPLRFGFDEIAALYVRRYRPVAEYGGWGLKRGSSGQSYSQQGDHGLQIVLRSGERVLVGTQRPAEIDRAVRSVAPHLVASASLVSAR